VRIPPRSDAVIRRTGSPRIDSDPHPAAGSEVGHPRFGVSRKERSTSVMSPRRGGSSHRLGRCGESAMTHASPEGGSPDAASGGPPVAEVLPGDRQMDQPTCRDRPALPDLRVIHFVPLDAQPGSGAAPSSQVKLCGTSTLTPSPGVHAPRSGEIQGEGGVHHLGDHRRAQMTVAGLGTGGRAQYRPPRGLLPESACVGA
jgi:hypothetical protein